MPEEIMSAEQVSQAFRRFEEESQKALDAAYRRGYADAVTNYAVWKNGEQLVGVMQRPLKEVLEEVKNQSVPIRY